MPTQNLIKCFAKNLTPQYAKIKISGHHINRRTLILEIEIRVLKVK
jgi:hypothetical protein